MNKIILNIIFLLFSVSAFCQLMTNNGALIYSQNDAVIAVQGSLNNKGTFNHNGYILIDSSFSNNNYFSGNGVFDLFGNWQNSGSFICDTSHVHLKGDIQIISGDSVTKFYKLSCEGSSKKILQQNARIKKQINLNALEFSTTDDTLFVDNTALDAVLFNSTFGSEGFISSSDIGSLVRSTSIMNSYKFPVGSSVGTPRYRPVEIIPQNNAQNSYAVSFINHLPDFDNYDTSLCDINKKFYHKVNRINGNTKGMVSIYYLPGTDNYYNKLGFPLNNNIWSAITQSNLTSANPYSFVFYPLWDAAGKQLILANKGLHISTVHGDSVVCLNETGHYLTSSYTGFFPVWNTINGTISDSSVMSALWNIQGQGMVSVYLKNPLNNCISNTINYSVYVAQLPVADFNYNQSTQQNNNYISFTDHSTGNINSWGWDFGNSHTSTDQNPQTEYTQNGQYNTVLTVKNNYGCIDTATKIIRIDEAIFIPSAFTPGSDGFNDYFEILYNGNFEYEIKILNRWGQELWKGNQNTIWDGKTKAGAECSAGTYYYFLFGTMNGQKKEFKGAVELIR